MPDTASDSADEPRPLWGLTRVQSLILLVAVIATFAYVLYDEFIDASLARERLSLLRADMAAISQPGGTNVDRCEAHYAPHKAHLLCTYTSDLAPAALEKHYDVAFAARGWTRCSGQGRSVSWRYCKGTESALVETDHVPQQFSIMFDGGPGS
jgi:hypothetical protein